MTLIDFSPSLTLKPGFENLADNLDGDFITAKVFLGLSNEFFYYYCILCKSAGNVAKMFFIILTSF